MEVTEKNKNDIIISLQKTLNKCKKLSLPLDKVADILKENPELKLSIEGHTSNDGNANKNMQLSQDRADNVKAYFISKGIFCG